MTANERFKRFKDRMNLSYFQMAELFGVDVRAVHKWYAGEAELDPDIQKTLLRFECANLVALSPNLSQETVQAFREGQRRAEMTVEVGE